jgi:hypothetical protein
LTGVSWIKKTIERYSAAHVKGIVHFVKMLRARIATVLPADRQKPLQFPIVEIGYAKRYIDRLKDHTRHRSSNYIMYLTESFCAALQSTFGSLYRIEQAAIYLIWAPEQAEISEIGFTKLAEGYTHDGGGFSHFPAGLSNHFVNYIVTREWNGAQGYVIERSVYAANLRIKRARQEKEMLEREATVAKKRQKEYQDRSLLGRRAISVV